MNGVRHVSQEVSFEGRAYFVTVTLDRGEVAGIVLGRMRPETWLNIPKTKVATQRITDWDNPEWVRVHREQRRSVSLSWWDRFKNDFALLIRGSS